MTSKAEPKDVARPALGHSVVVRYVSSGGQAGRSWIARLEHAVPGVRFETAEMGEVEAGSVQADAYVLEFFHVDTSVHDVIRNISGGADGKPVLVIGPQDGSLLACLDMGAEDVVPGGASEVELLARLRKLVRHTRAAAPDQTIRIGDVVLDRIGQRLWCRGTPVPITRREFTMLLCLAYHVGRSVAVQELCEFMWVYRGRRRSCVGTVQVHISRLRRLLRESSLVSIETVPRIGYRMRVATSFIAASGGSDRVPAPIRRIAGIRPGTPGQ